jgi:hypothetical protein
MKNTLAFVTALTPVSQRVDRSLQTAARAKETGTLAKPACPLSGIASEASVARSEVDIASDVSSGQGERRPLAREPLEVLEREVADH